MMTHFLSDMKVIKHKNLPAKLPISQTLTIFLAMDYWCAPDWMFGAVSFAAVVVWIACIYSIASNESIDLFKK
jgi:hypothetical protein